MAGKGFGRIVTKMRCYGVAGLILIQGVESSLRLVESRIENYVEEVEPQRLRCVLPGSVVIEEIVLAILQNHGF